ncbi:MAG TPA: cytidine deaminase [Thermodesulfovibrionales bacterium]|nr:cytidine deaminase [Thermodesulfovibrionales bacterium]
MANGMLPSDILKLVKAAEEAIASVVAPFSGFSVGVALMTGEGRIYRGCNIENPSLMLSFCAERAALIKALTEGERTFRAMAIASNCGKYCFPCGPCRQMLAEFASDIDVYIACDKGIRKYSIPELLPHPFRL